MILYNMLSFEEQYVLCPACVKCSVDKQWPFPAALIMSVMKKNEFTPKQHLFSSAISDLKQEAPLE